MYTSFFGLNEKPFAITPDPRYLFLSERHGEGLAHLLYGVTDSGGFIQLTGEVGTGKTTLVRTLLGQLPKEVDVALILNPQVTVLEFLQAICLELGLDLPEDRSSPMAMVDSLNRFLLDAHASGRRIILLVDEAQNLSEEVLEQLRLLTNLETAKQKLLQIILIGQPELREVLAQNSLRQLAQRVTGRYHLEPLSREEAAQYIDHRMRVAGAVGAIFDDDAKREVHRLSGGIPRLMNVICDRSLLGAYSREQRYVDKAIVRSAAREVSGSDDRRRAGPPIWRWAAGLAAVAIAVAAGFGLARVYENNLDARSTAATDATAPPAGSAPIMAVADAADNDGGSETDANIAVRPDDEPAVGPGSSLAEELKAGRLDTSAASAMRQMLARWGLRFDPAAGQGCEQAGAAGLSCLWQRGSFTMLEQLDRPAILMLTDPEGETHQAVLQFIRDDQAVLSFGSARINVPVDEISDLWFGQFMLLWRPPVAGGRAITPGMSGPQVLWLRKSLAEIDGIEAAADDEYFDDALESRVREFQRANRLKVDGLAGEQTQIIINSIVSVNDAPRLSGES